MLLLGYGILGTGRFIVLLERCMIVLMNEYKQIAKLNNFSIKNRAT
jgi:hypothetical protein